MVRHPAMTRSPLRGDEPLRAATADIATVEDFWRWAFSDLVINTTRGCLAEFIVAKALDLTGAVRSAWDSYDLRTPSGLRIEVKSGANLQAWGHDQLSRIVFSIAPRRSWNPDAGATGAVPTRSADVYVFCLLHHREKQTLDPLDLSQWSFYVVRTEILDSTYPSAKGLSLKALLQLQPVSTAFGDLKAALLGVDER
jgi:hypothetical protein